MKLMTDLNDSLPTLIGLSGPSGAGKNTACDVLKDYGFYCIDADLIAKDVFLTSQKELVELFAFYADKKGIPITYANEKRCCEENIINKHNFAYLVFSDSKLLELHERFILPKIECKMREEIQKAFLENHTRPIVLNAPTLHKTKLIYECKFIIYITAPFFIRFFRIRKRDRLPFKNILLRFSKQKEFFSQYFLLNADTELVKNSGSAAQLKVKLLRTLKKRGF